MNATGPRSFVDSNGRQVTSTLRRAHAGGDAGSAGSFITTAAVNLTVTLNVQHIPSEGGQVRASGAASTPGGGFVVAAAARAQGVRTFLASPLGTGPNSHSVRRAIREAGVETFESGLVGDIGVAVAMVEEDGKAAQVLAPGVEAETSADLLEQVPVTSGDVVHVSGADLASNEGGRALVEWVRALPSSVTVVLSASPAVSLVPAQTWVDVLARADILTMNIREAAVLTVKLKPFVSGEWFQGVAKPGAPVVRRMGPLGCEVITDGGRERVAVPAIPARPVDTTGVGDTHVAVMCAALVQGSGLAAACHRANAASALELSHSTAFPLPTAAQVDQVLLTRDTRLPVPSAASGVGAARHHREATQIL